jgi:hypothetical protein
MYLDERPETYTITTNSKADDSYSWEKNIVYWDPTSAVRTTSGGRQSPALVLAHELEHARNDAEGDMDLRKMPGAYDLVEEWNVITGPETEIANELGEDTRNNHRGNFYKVWGPTDR